MWLVTGASTPLGGWLADALQAQGTAVRLVDSVALPPTAAARFPAAEVFTTPLDAGEATDRLMDGVVGVLHVVPYHCRYSAEEGLTAGAGWLDECTRRTYHLLAAAAGSPTVRRVLLVSTLDLFAPYPPELVIDETWLPRPTTSGTVLGPHLAEFIAREFGRCSASLRVAVARLGRLTAELGAEEQRAVSALLSLLGDVEGEEYWSQGNNVIGNFVAAADDVLSFRITHLDIGHTSRGSPPSDIPIDNLPHGAVSRGTKPTGDDVLLLGGRGMLGPDVVVALRATDRTVRVTDKTTTAGGGSGGPGSAAQQMETLDAEEVDIGAGLQVLTAAKGTSVIVNCAVNRTDRDLAFHVNTAGTYFALLAAVAQGHDRFVNTGPMTVIAGEDEASGTFYQLREEGPLQPGTNLYAMTKALGVLISRAFSDNFPISVLTCCLSQLIDPKDTPKAGGGLRPFATTKRDVATGVALATSVELSKMP